MPLSLQNLGNAKGTAAVAEEEAAEAAEDITNDERREEKGRERLVWLVSAVISINVHFYNVISSSSSSEYYKVS